MRKLIWIKMINSWNFMIFFTVFLAVLVVSGVSSAITYEYDELNRLTQVVYDDGTKITYTYDAAGNIISTNVEKDTDGDGVYDSKDNCLAVYNPDQKDSDQDEIGDACDRCASDPGNDTDGDGICGDLDNCPTVANSDQVDWDSDGLGDVCDDDLDGDQVANDSDQCQFTAIGEVTDPSNGCSIDQLAPCDGPMNSSDAWENHGQYASAVAHATSSFLKQGLITNHEKRKIISEAAQSQCGKKRHKKQQNKK